MCYLRAIAERFQGGERSRRNRQNVSLYRYIHAGNLKCEERPIRYTAGIFLGPGQLEELNDLIDR